MPGFLQEVAADLYDRYGDDISSLSVLFPSRRARLFFIDALSGIAERPLWQPRWTTIDELMSEISGLRIGDRVRLVTELYKVYSEFHPESFDKFYFWGEMLLTDFDTIDKYLIDADMLFRNLADIKELEADVSYLSPVQLKIIAFWANFTDETSLSEEKRRFLAVWQTLGPVYRTFRERLRSLGMAYTGMVHRAAAERIKAGGFAFPESRRFVVAGFNALSECEKRLFKFLSTAAETDFYWDYDAYYKDNPEQEAGMFVRSNVALFPPRTEFAHDNMRGEKEVVSVAAVSNAVQCKYAAAILADLARRRREEDSGIAAGAVWAVIPAIFKAKWNTNETLFTLMMNYIATQLVAYFIIIWEVPKGSGKIGIINQDTQAGWLPTIGNQKYLLAILVVAILTGLMYIYLNYSKHGYEIAVVGESRRTASYAGIKVDRVIIRTMALSGALCGLIGLLLTSSTDHTMTTTIVDGRGFTAVMVSWMAKFNPVIMIFVSLLLVVLSRGASEISTAFGLNRSFSDILTGIILFFIIGCEFFINYKVQFRSSGKKEA